MGDICNSGVVAQRSTPTLVDSVAERPSELGDLAIVLRPLRKPIRQ